MTHLRVAFPLRGMLWFSVQKLWGPGLTLALLAISWPTAAQGFRNVEPGEALPPKMLPALGGQEARPYLPGNSKVGAFIFFRPDTENSQRALSEIAKCVKPAFEDPLRIVGIASNVYPAEDVQKAVKDAQFPYPVLVDVGDALYGQLGAFVLPSFGVVDRQGRLASYEAFHRVNLCNLLVAQIRFAAGTITKAELDAVLHPKRAVDGGAQATAKRRLNLGKKLLNMGKIKAAITTIRKAISLAPDQAAAHGLYAAALARQNKCDEAQAAARSALAIDSKEQSALQAQEHCSRASASSSPQPQKATDTPPAKASPTSP